MDQSLIALCNALKKLFTQLKSQEQAYSFTLVIGKAAQGKSTLLRQSNLQHISVDSSISSEIYYNENGILIELNENWLNQSKHLLQNSLKQLNRCHRHFKINGILLCVDINELFNSTPDHLTEMSQHHVQLLKRFGSSLGYSVSLAILFTKLDSLAGFCEFYQNDHHNELTKPLGFSLFLPKGQTLFLKQYREQFDYLIERLNQQVISKVHPVRSSIKRTLIREFPLQFSSLKLSIQLFLQAIPLQYFQIKAIYLTSAEQGGLSQDRLNTKIKHEYALSVQDKYHQPVNYRAYFVDGALAAFQKLTKQSIPVHYTATRPIIFLSSIIGLSLIWVGYNHFKSSNVLDEVSKELLMFETMAREPENHSPAVFHLANASNALERISVNAFSFPTLQYLKTKLKENTQQRILGNFLPTILNEIELEMLNPQGTNANRYQALKVYIMLSDPTRYSQTTVMDWFNNKWRETPLEQRNKKIALLQQILREPMQPFAINPQFVSDTRNYLNALPASYLFYSLTKEHFTKQVSPIVFEGFQLSNQELPFYLTKAGFTETIQQLPKIIQTLQLEHWVLGRNDITSMTNAIQQAYCYEYVTWWQHFINQTQPLHFQDYQQAHQLTKILQQTNSLPQLISFIQQQTSPDHGENASLFNQEIASQFTQLNLLGQTALNELSSNLSELEAFLNTLSLINDQGKTAFTLARARFNGDTLANPLSALFNRAKHLPEPVSNWANQIASELWYLLIRDTRNYINQQWQLTVFNYYKNQIEARFPFDPTQQDEVSLNDFERFFATHGLLNQFMDTYVKPFLDTSRAEWQPKELNNYVLPFPPETLEELMRTNVITNMFFPSQSEQCKIEFSLQKIGLDPVVSDLQLSIGNLRLKDNQNTESFARFYWPEQNASLALNTIEGEHYELDETGIWGFFRMLQKVNVLVDEQDSSRLQILFELNGNSGRYILKTSNQINPFIPGILNGFKLPEYIA
ncbi:type IVB secretion system protein IcmF [Legionella impletisoli]|uniref:Type VI secretion protein IcmF n=1 Tax=Legionella impletisoli TaxID=343510 RepID=A0A917NCY9_9GAMM|nr:type IVB secretion system protein IcmF [Legionella impletisoli]GGI89869.1 type VI secretion protein IcmF [Legionella impletisoli]